MYLFDDPKFKNSVLDLARIYGPYDFWLQNLNPDSNPNAIWRACLIIGCLSDIRFIRPVRQLLNSGSSRVRAWACFALSQMMDQGAIPLIARLSKDNSYRVRFHSRIAMEKLGFIESKPQIPYLPIQISRRLRLIISDDSENIQKQLFERFSTYGYEVLVSSQSKDTIELARDKQPNFIITDNQKFNDNLSGLDMTWDIARDPHLDKSTIVMLTADQLEAIFTWNGGDFFFNKITFHLHFLDTILEDCALSEPLRNINMPVHNDIHHTQNQAKPELHEPRIKNPIEECIHQITSPKKLYSFNEIKNLPKEITSVRGVFACYSKIIPPNIIVPQEYKFLGSTLLFIGICPRSENRRTLLDRWKEIFEGDADAAIIRLTLGCLLSKALNIQLTWQKNKWTFLEGETAVSKWVADNISITWFKYQKPWEIRKRVIQEICPALNDQNNPKNPNNNFLRNLRAKCKQPV